MPSLTNKEMVGYDSEGSIVIDGGTKMETWTRQDPDIRLSIWKRK